MARQLFAKCLYSRSRITKIWIPCCFTTKWPLLIQHNFFACPFQNKFSSTSKTVRICKKYVKHFFFFFAERLACAYVRFSEVIKSIYGKGTHQRLAKWNLILNLFLFQTIDWHKRTCSSRTSKKKKEKKNIEREIKTVP